MSTHRITRRALLKGVGLASASLVLAACTAPAATPAPGQPAQPTAAVPAKDEIIVSNTTDINILDPHKMQATVDEFIWHTVFAGLTRFEPTMANPLPEMAESWDRPDDTTFVFHLRQGVKWHSGRDFTADDILWNWQRVQEIGSAGRIQGYMSDVASIEKIDDHTVQFNLKAPSAVFLIYTPLFVFVDPETADQIDTNPIGTGPYRFGEWIPNDHVTLIRNEDFWDKSINRPAKLTLRPITEAQTMVAALQTGEIDVAGNLAPALEAELRSSPGVVVHVPEVSASYYVINFNVTKPPFDNMKLRQAVAAAIDREAIWRNVLFGNGKPSCNPIPDTSWAYDPAQECGPRNVELAKQLIAESGVTLPLQLELKVFSTPPQPRIAEIIQANLAEIGIEIAISPADFAVWLEDVWINKNYEITTTQYTRESDPDGLMSSVFRKGLGNNVMGYDNPRVDELFDLAKAEYDQAKRAEYYQEIVDIVLEEAPLVKIASNFAIWGARDNIKNVKILPRGFVLYADLTL